MKCHSMGGPGQCFLGIVCFELAVFFFEADFDLADDFLVFEVDFVPVEAEVALGDEAAETGS